MFYLHSRDWGCLRRGDRMCHPLREQRDSRAAPCRPVLPVPLAPPAPSVYLPRPQRKSQDLLTKKRTTIWSAHMRYIGQSETMIPVYPIGLSRRLTDSPSCLLLGNGQCSFF